MCIFVLSLEHPDMDRNFVCYTGAVPHRARPNSAWGIQPPLAATQLISSSLLSEDQSILHLRLTAQHLLIITASNAAASATWLSTAQLQQTAVQSLPAGVCHAWSSAGLTHMILSCQNGDVYTMLTDHEVKTALLDICACAGRMSLCAVAFPL